MDASQMMGIWTALISLVPPIFFTLCLVFIFNFFQGWKANNDERMANAKMGAVLCLAIALMTPVFFGHYLTWLMMR